MGENVRQTCNKAFSAPLCVYVRVFCLYIRVLALNKIWEAVSRVAR